MAPDPRVPAAAAAPRERPAGVRRGGWTRRRKEHPASSPSSGPMASLRQGVEPLPIFLLEHAGGDGYGRRGHRKPKHHSSGCGEGPGPSAIDLEQGKAYPSPQFPSCDMEIEEDPLPSMSQPRLPGSARESDRPLGRRPPNSSRGKDPPPSGPWSQGLGQRLTVWGCVLREMPSEVFSSC